jgi:hypothetical protein
MSRCPKFRSAVFGLVEGVSAGFTRRTGVDDLTDESGLRGMVLLLSFFILSVLAGVRTPLSDAIIRRRDIITIDYGVLG